MRSSWVLRRLRPLLATAPAQEESRWLPRMRRVSSPARSIFVSPTTMAIAESFSSSLNLSTDPRNFIAGIHPVMLFSTAVSSDGSDKEGWDMEWEEEECVDPQVGDGGDGGGIVLGDVGWGGRALSAAQEVLLRDFGSDIVMFAFKVSPKGYIYVRLDKLTNQ